jgi:hypothetical protein
MYGCISIANSFIHPLKNKIMTNKIFSLTLALLASFIFTNCEKENPCELLGNCTEVLLMDPANAENPFDEIGARHNEGLALLRKNYQSDIDAMNAASPIEAEHYIFARSAEFAASSPDLHHHLRGQLRLNGSDQLLSRFNFADYGKWLSMLDIDDETRQALRNGIAAVVRIEPGTVEATNEIIRAIKEQERALLAQENLPGRDFALVLMAVWRYSNHYWMGGGNGEPIPAKAKWWQVGLADAACGAVGFLLGGPAGGIGLGVGASKVVADYKD